MKRNLRLRTRRTACYLTKRNPNFGKRSNVSLRLPVYISKELPSTALRRGLSVNDFVGVALARLIEDDRCAYNAEEGCRSGFLGP